MKAAIALGSNLGDRLTKLREAAVELEALSRQPLRKSRLYETSPVDCPTNSPKFLNAVVELTVDDHTSPEELLRQCQAIEKRLGRKPKAIHNEPRPIDLDLICCGTAQRNTPGLVLPHPRAHLRRFVLQPLCDLVPDLVLPGQTKNARELLASLADDSTVRRFAESW